MSSKKPSAKIPTLVFPCEEVTLRENGETEVMISNKDFLKAVEQARKLLASKKHLKGVNVSFRLGRGA